MTWEIHRAGDAFPQFAEDWNRLNDELHVGHPAFDSRFVGALLAHFGSGSESLCIHRSGEVVDGALILSSRGFGAGHSSCRRRRRSVRCSSRTRAASKP